MGHSPKNPLCPPRKNGENRNTATDTPPNQLHALAESWISAAESQLVAETVAACRPNPTKSSLEYLSNNFDVGNLYDCARVFSGDDRGRTAAEFKTVFVEECQGAERLAAVLVGEKASDGSGTGIMRQMQVLFRRKGLAGGPPAVVPAEEQLNVPSGMIEEAGDQHPLTMISPALEAVMAVLTAMAQESPDLRAKIAGSGALGILGAIVLAHKDDEMFLGVREGPSVTPSGGPRRAGLPGLLQTLRLLGCLIIDHPAVRDGSVATADPARREKEFVRLRKQCFQCGGEATARKWVGLYLDGIFARSSGGVGLFEAGLDVVSVLATHEPIDEILASVEQTVGSSDNYLDPYVGLLQKFVVGRSLGGGSVGAKKADDEAGEKEGGEDRPVAKDQGSSQQTASGSKQVLPERAQEVPEIASAAEQAFSGVVVRSTAFCNAFLACANKLFLPLVKRQGTPSPASSKSDKRSAFTAYLASAATRAALRNLLGTLMLISTEDDNTTKILDENPTTVPSDDGDGEVSPSNSNASEEDDTARIPVPAPNSLLLSAQLTLVEVIVAANELVTSENREKLGNTPVPVSLLEKLLAFGKKEPLKQLLASPALLLDGDVRPFLDAARRCELLDAEVLAAFFPCCAGCGRMPGVFPQESAEKAENGKAENGKSGSPTKLKNCSRCKKVAYCSTECQQSDWAAHKGVCGK